jgi:CHAT domain-containing protein
MAAIARARHLVIVTEPRLGSIWYAALRHDGHYLVERLPIAIATSAGSLRRQASGPETFANSKAAAIALPSGDGSMGLPEIEGEADDVAKIYRNGDRISRPTFAALCDAAATHDVLHVAGHTAREPAGDAALLFAAGERAAWNRIAAEHFPHTAVVVLAACETLREPARPDVHTLSLGAAFLAAGARDVVGTLAPIADDSAHSIFRELHRNLAAGIEPCEALRRAQLSEINAGRDGWQAVALLTNHIPF